MGACSTAGQYAKLSNHQCTNCHDNCATCDEPTSNGYYCLSCTGNYSLSGSACVDPCPDSFISVSNVCQSCNVNSCRTCSAVGTCTLCTTGTYLLNNVCYFNCPSQYYINGNVCSACDNTKCYNCNTSATDCSSCPPSQATALVYLVKDSGLSSTTWHC